MLPNLDELTTKMSELASSIQSLEHEVKIMRDAHHSEAIDLADNLTKQLEIERAVNQNRNNMNMLARDIDYKSTMVETLKPELALLEQQIFDAQTMAEQEAQAAAVPKLDFEDDDVIDGPGRISEDLQVKLHDAVKSEIKAAHAASGINEEEFRAMAAQACQQGFVAPDFTTPVDSTAEAKKVIDSWLKFNANPNGSAITPELTTSPVTSRSDDVNKGISDAITGHLANMVAEDITNHPSVKSPNNHCGWKEVEVGNMVPVTRPLSKWHGVSVIGTNTTGWDTVSEPTIDATFPHVAAKATEPHPNPWEDVTIPVGVPVLGSITGEEMLTPVYQEAPEPEEVATKPAFQNTTWCFNHASCGGACNGTSPIVVNTTIPS